MPSIFYKKYLKSDDWNKKKQSHLECFNTCYVCGSNKKLEVHHKTYERLGNELKTDLVTLCSYHHKILHEMADDKGWVLLEAHKILKSRHERNRIPKKYKEKFSNKNKAKNAKKTKEAIDVVNEIMLRSYNITRQELYDEAKNILGSSKWDNIKRVVQSMIKKRKIVVIDKSMQLLCLNPKVIMRK